MPARTLFLSIMAFVGAAAPAHADILDSASIKDVQLQVTPSSDTSTVRVKDRKSGRTWVRQRAGRRVLAAAVNNTGVAWIEQQAAGRGRMRITVWAATLRPVARAARKVETRTFARSSSPPDADIAFANDGTVAWGDSAVDGSPISIKRPGKRVLRRESGYPLEVGVDDGRLLWWAGAVAGSAADVEVGTLDLPNAKPKAGCPARSRFSTLFAPGSAARVTSATWDLGTPGLSESSQDSAVLRSVNFVCNNGREVRVDEVAATPSGRVAWVAGRKLLSTAPGSSGATELLDTGTITDLSFSGAGDFFQWKNGGSLRVETT